jgi:ribosome recycling factor
LKDSEKEVQAATDESIKNLDAIAAEKEKELLEV